MYIKRAIFTFIFISLCLCSSAKTRLIVMSDIGGSDPDDTQSLVHLFVSLDQVELEGFISQHAWAPYGKNAIGFIHKMINGYETVLPNLKIHSSEYPSADYLRSIVKQGQSKAAMHGVGEGKDSEGSEWIIQVVDQADERPVWISAWSGLNTLAQALWKVSHTRSQDEIDAFVKKIRVYDILGQDDAGAWIVKNYPELIYIRNRKIYGWPPSDEWLRENIQNIGPLGSLYPNREWATEGDTPSFLYCLDNGLNVPEHPEYGGWGGRFNTTRIAGIRGMDFVKRNGLDETAYDPYYMIPSAPEGGEAIIRWKNEIHNDFAARMQWSITPDYSKANHHPLAAIGKDISTRIVNRSVKPGERVTLNAEKSYDPDNDKLHFEWEYYKEPSTYAKGTIAIESSTERKCHLVVPNDAAGSTIHIVLKVTDNGTPTLTSYRRIILHVKP